MNDIRYPLFLVVTQLLRRGFVVATMGRIRRSQYHFTYERSYYSLLSINFTSLYPRNCVLARIAFTLHRSSHVLRSWSVLCQTPGASCPFFHLLNMFGMHCLVHTSLPSVLAKRWPRVGETVAVDIRCVRTAAWMSVDPAVSDDLQRLPSARKFRG